MITYRNQLKNKIDSLQKLINEINESGLEGINIREGVIVDMTCNIIITSSLITDELISTKINTNELTTNELTSNNLMITSSNNNLSLNATEINGSSTKANLDQIVGQYYSTLNVGTIFQYSNVSKYDNRVYRDSSGAIFPYEGCLIEWTYGQLTP